MTLNAGKKPEPKLALVGSPQPASIEDHAFLAEQTFEPGLLLGQCLANATRLVKLGEGSVGGEVGGPFYRYARPGPSEPVPLCHEHT